eukprot:4492491-Prymnesium_polylepis.1
MQGVVRVASLGCGSLRLRWELGAHIIARLDHSGGEGPRLLLFGAQSLDGFEAPTFSADGSAPPSLDVTSRGRREHASKSLIGHPHSLPPAAACQKRGSALDRWQRCGVGCIAFVCARVRALSHTAVSFRLRLRPRALSHRR